MLTTPNFNLKKIELADSPPDITVLNANWDTIDAELMEINANAELKALKAKDTVVDFDIVNTGSISGFIKTKVIAGINQGTFIIDTNVTDNPTRTVARVSYFAKPTATAIVHIMVISNNGQVWVGTSDYSTGAIIQKFQSVPNRFIRNFGQVDAGNVLFTAWVEMGGTGNPYGTFLVTIRDNVLNKFYVGVHDYNHGGWQNVSKIGGDLEVAANSVGTVSTTTGVVENQEYVIQLLSILR